MLENDELAYSRCHFAPRRYASTAPTLIKLTPDAGGALALGLIIKSQDASRCDAAGANA